jgi:hypothetical protein
MNTELFDRVLAHIEAHPHMWDQNVVWHSTCGTRHCFAGFVEIIGGLGTDSGPREIDGALGVSSDEGIWLSGVDRTLDDFRRFREAGGIPEAS